MRKVRFNWKPVIVLVISLIVLTTTVFGLRQWQRNRLAYNSLQVGLKAYENHIWQKTAANLGRYLAVNPDDVEILLKYAEAQLKIRPLKRYNIQQAAATYRSILRINRENQTATEELIGLYLQLNIPAEAELIARRYLQTNKNPTINTMLAMALAKQRKFKEAAIQLHSVIKEHPDQILAYEVLGQLAEHQGEDFPSTVEYWFNEAVKNNPSSAKALIVRAGFYLRDRQIAAAVTDLETAEKLDLSDISVRLRLATEFANVNMLEKARWHLARIQDQNPANPALWQTWAVVALKTMSEEEMLNVAQTGLKELAPNVWDFMLKAAELFIRCGQFDQASDCLTKLKQKEIDLVTVAFLEGLLAEAQKQDHKAVLFWRRAQQLGDKSEKTHMALAMVYWRLGDRQSAILQLRTLASEQPSLFSGHYHLARLLAQTGSWAEAAEQARLASQISAANIDALLLCIRAQMQLAQSSQLDTNEQIWQEIETQMAKLKDSIGSLPEFKLLQFQLEMHRGQHAQAEKLLSDFNTDGDKSIEVAIAKIDLLIAKDKIEQAISELYNLREKFPHSVLPSRYLAILLAKHRDKTDCEKVLKEALQSIDEPVAKRDLGILLATFYNQWYQEQKAYELFTSLAKQLPSDIPIKRQLLKNDRVKKDVDYAQQLIDEIRFIEGDQGWQWRYEQANLWLAGEHFKDHYAQIITLLKKNLNANPDDQTSRTLLAETYEKAGELHLAITTYREALNRTPRDLRIIIPAVAVMYKAKEYEQADEILNRATKQNFFGPQISQLKLKSYLRKGDFSSAETILEDLMTKYPNNHTISLSLALLKMRDNKYDHAYALLNKLKAEQPDALPVTTALVELNVRQEKNEEALALCNEFIRQLGSASAYILRGKTYLMLGRNILAQKDFEQAIIIEPENVQAWISKSDFNRSMGRYDEAFEDIQKALALNPENLQIQKRFIAALLSSSKTDKFSRCREFINKALSSNPQDIELKLYKARCVLAKGTAPAIEQAQFILQKITEEQPGIADSWGQWAQIYLEQAQFGKAMDTVLRGLTYSPNDKNLLLLKARVEAARAPALAIPTLKLLNDSEPNNAKMTMELAKTYVAAGQCDKSITLLQNLLTCCEEKEHRKIKTALAASLYKNGDKDQARHLFDLLYESGPDDSRLFLTETSLLKDDESWDTLSLRSNDWIKNNPNDTHALITLAGNLVATKKQGALDIAEFLLREILRLNPHCLETMNSLAVLLQIRGQYSEATDVYKQILDIKPDTLIALNNLAWITCEQQGKYQQALEFAQTGLQKAPEYVDLIDTRGVIYYRMAEHHKALKDFNKCLELCPKNSLGSAILRLHLARSQIALGQNGKAADNLQKTIELNNKIGGLSSTEVVEAQLLLDELLKKDGNVHGNR
jgi:tetratricopeptide (TPR) repeat protein